MAAETIELGELSEEASGGFGAVAACNKRASCVLGELRGGRCRQAASYMRAC
ncbi:unnamed protein product, partial [Musa banksii]